MTHFLAVLAVLLILCGTSALVSLIVVQIIAAGRGPEDEDEDDDEFLVVQGSRCGKMWIKERETSHGITDWNNSRKPHVS